MTDPSTHLFWITSRAAGDAALILASASVTLGLLMGGRLAVPPGRPPERKALHEALAVACLVAVSVHGLALIGDPWLRAGPLDIALPFASRYRPLWTGLGVLAAWGLAALGLSYYWRGRIGPSRWRLAHRFTVVFWALGVVHAIGAGTDAPAWWYRIMLVVLVLPVLGLLPARLGAASRRAGRSRARGAPAPPRPARADGSRRHAVRSPSTAAVEPMAGVVGRADRLARRSRDAPAPVGRAGATTGAGSLAGRTGR